MTDKEALKAAMDQAMENPHKAGQLNDKLNSESWTAVAEFAAFCCQCDSLNLKPWQEPPCVADPDDPDERDKSAQRLLRRMLDAGVSRYHPDPLEALEV